MTPTIPESQLKVFCKMYLSAECNGTCRTCTHRTATLAQMKPVGGAGCEARQAHRSCLRPVDCRYCGTCGEVR